MSSSDEFTFGRVELEGPETSNTWGLGLEERQGVVNDSSDHG